MASGRKDYKAEVIPVLTVTSAGQTPINQYAETELETASADDLFSLATGAGTITYITELFISCDMPGINKVELKAGSTVFYTAFFDTIHTHVFSGGTGLVITGAATLHVYLTNLDTVTVNFYGWLLGFYVEDTF